jgi:uncharacterized alpha-E superfamily protein
LSFDIAGEQEDAALQALTLAHYNTEHLSVLTAIRNGRWSAHQVRNALTKTALRSDDRKVLFAG